MLKTDAFAETLSQIGGSLDLISSKYGLLTKEQQPVLLRDIKYLLLDNIAQEIKLVFYNPDKPQQIFLEYIYSVRGMNESRNMLDGIMNEGPPAIAFDVYIEFTHAFQTMAKSTQELLVRNTEFEWYPI